MSGDSLEMLITRGRPGTTRPTTVAARPSVVVENGADEDECAAFGYLRGVRDRALSIEFRLANGNSQAYPYSWLGTMQYNPSVGILLKFVGDLIYLVLLEGANLNALVNDSVNLYDRGIQRHRVSWVREMTRQQLERAGKGEVSVERIRILSYNPDEGPKDAEWLESFLEPRLT